MDSGQSTAMMQRMNRPDRTCPQPRRPLMPDPTAATQDRKGAWHRTGRTGGSGRTGRRGASGGSRAVGRLLGLGLSVLFAGAVSGLARPAQAAEPAYGVRSLAMGESMRAAATGAEGSLINPSGIAISKLLAATAFYSLRVQTLGHIAHASISDSVAQRFLALGLYYNFIYETPHFSYRLPEGGNTGRLVLVEGSKIVRTGSESGVVVAVPITERFSIGGSLKYGYYTLTSQLTDGTVPADFNYQSPLIDQDHNVDLGSVGHVVTFDLGATARVWDELRVAVVGQNLWPHGIELPTRLGIGLSYRPGARWLVAADAVINFTGSIMCTGMEADPCSEQAARTTARFGGGVEYSIADRVPLRAGYVYDTELEAHHITAGLGYMHAERGIGVDFALRQRVDGGNESVLLLGLRLVKE